MRNNRFFCQHHEVLKLKEALNLIKATLVPRCSHCPFSLLMLHKNGFEKLEGLRMRLCYYISQEILILSLRICSAWPGSSACIPMSFSAVTAALKASLSAGPALTAPSSSSCISLADPGSSCSRVHASQVLEG